MNENSAGIQSTENCENVKLQYLFYKIEFWYLMSNDDFGSISEECENDGYDKFMAQIEEVDNNQQHKPNLGGIYNDEQNGDYEEIKEVENNQQHKPNLDVNNNNDEEKCENNDNKELYKFGGSSLFNHYHYKRANAQQDVDYIFNRNINNDGGNNEIISIEQKFGTQEVGYLGGYEPDDQVLKEIMMRYVVAEIQLARKKRREMRSTGVIPQKERNSKRGQCHISD